MSSNNGNMPINLTSKNQQMCSVTCNYTYNYTLSDLVATTYDNYIQLSYNSPNSKIEYQDENYQVNEVRLYAPSLNKYYGKQYDGEIIIHHTSSDKNLIICIPIEKSDKSSSSSQLLHGIIPFLGQKNQPTSINVSNYTLNSFIPKGSYFIYNNANLLYPPYNGSYNYLLFDTTQSLYNNGNNPITIENKVININTSDYNRLIKLIKPINKLSIKPLNNNNLYYNIQGTFKGGNGTIDDDIYIDCRPTSIDGMPLSKISYSDIPSNRINNNLLNSNISTSAFNTLNNNTSLTNANTPLTNNNNNIPPNKNNDLLLGSLIAGGIGLSGLIIGGIILTMSLTSKKK